MIKRGAIFRRPSYWVCPTGVTIVRMTGIGPGGGGCLQTGVQASKGGGGAGEYCVNMPVIVVPGTTYFVDTGTLGMGGIGASVTDGTDGGATNFNGFRLLGGLHSPTGVGSTFGGSGGGPRGGVALVNDAFNGTAESPCHFGGASGGSGSGGGQAGFPGGQVIGQYPANVSPRSTSAAGAGSSGGCTMYTSGALGGPADAFGFEDASPKPNGFGGVDGAGGGGAQQDAGSTAQPSNGGNGGNGLILLTWVAP